MALAHITGLPVLLGAHPWWADKVLVIGLAAGIALALLARATGWPRGRRGLALLIATGAAFALASYGKARFAASYAEDGFAGQMWFLGWIATCTCATATVASFLWPNREPH